MMTGPPGYNATVVTFNGVITRSNQWTKTPAYANPASRGSPPIGSSSLAGWAFNGVLTNNDDATCSFFTNNDTTFLAGYYDETNSQPRTYVSQNCTFAFSTTSSSA
jgi:hypothetical protein